MNKVIANTFARENVPQKFNPLSARSGISTGPSWGNAPGSGAPTFRQFVVDLTVARSLGQGGVNGPLLITCAGRLISFRESYTSLTDPATNSVDDLVQICLDSPNQNDYLRLRPGGGIESYGFQRFYLINAAIPGSSEAVFWVCNDGRSLVLP